MPKALNKTYSEVIADIKKRTFSPIYFLKGEESYFIDEISKLFINEVLTPEEKEFNFSLYYGKDADPIAIISEARGFPLMSEKKLILIREAQDLKNFDAFEKYFQNPTESTILVFCHKYKDLDKRKKVTKVLYDSPKVTVFNSEKIKEYKLEEWIEGYIKRLGFQPEPKVSFMLSELLGNDLNKVVNEIEKLITNYQKGDKILGDDVMQKIGLSKEFNIFELQKAISIKDTRRANSIINYFGNNEKNHPIQQTIAFLYSYFAKLMILHKDKAMDKNAVVSSIRISPYAAEEYLTALKNYNTKKIREIIYMLCEYDLKTKGVDNASTSDKELMREMIFKILN